MILPIVTYGAPVLQQPCADVNQDYPGLTALIDALWATMYAAQGCGLAAPQVDIPVRLFVVDSASVYQQMEEEERGLVFDGDHGIQETFLNATILNTSDEQLWADTEGCLSMPGLAATVLRPWSIRIMYQDEAFRERIQIFSGLTARMIQHEYDHTEGILYPDRLDAPARKLYDRRLKRKTREGWKAPYPLR